MTVEIISRADSQLCKWWNARTFLPAVMADEIREKEHFLAFPIDDAGRAVKLWHYRGGVFRPDGESVVRALADEKLGEKSKSERLTDVVEMVKERSKIKESELNHQAANLINVKNGLLNWKTGDFLTHSSEDLSTFQLNASYKSDAKSAAVDTFLAEVFPSDALTLAEELLGYLMLPTTKHQKAFMLVGEGANGKSTFFEMLEAFIGKGNVSHVSLQDLTANRFVVPMLQGKLANVYADIPQTGLEQSDIFKALVSGDTIKAEQKFGRPFDFKPVARLLFSANELPRSRDLTPAYFRRWVIIPFLNVFDGSKAKRDLLLSLTTEEGRSALLNRAVAGLRRLEDQQGFSDCPSVRDAGQQYRRQCDSAFEFISERMEADPVSLVGKTETYQTYAKWAQEAGIGHAASQKAFNKRLKETLKAGEGRESGARVWTGIRWRSEAGS